MLFLWLFQILYSGTCNLRSDRKQVASASHCKICSCAIVHSHVPMVHSQQHATYTHTCILYIPLLKLPYYFWSFIICILLRINYSRNYAGRCISKERPLVFNLLGFQEMKKRVQSTRFLFASSPRVHSFFYPFERVEGCSPVSVSWLPTLCTWRG